MTEEEKIDTGCVLAILIVIAFCVIWRFWYVALPIFAITLLAYVCYEIKGLPYTLRKKAYIISGTVLWIGILCVYVRKWNWVLPIVISFCSAGYIWIIEPLKQKTLKALADAAEKRRREEAAAEKAAKEEARRAKRKRVINDWFEWGKSKVKYVESWFSTADVILDTNVLMDKNDKDYFWQLLERNLHMDVSMETIMLGTIERVGREVEEWSYLEFWNDRVTAHPGWALFKILCLRDCDNAKVVVPGALLDELANVTHNNPSGSPKWKAAQEAKNRILCLQKMGRVIIPDVKARPDRWAYLDATLIDLVARRKKVSGTSRPIRIVTFDRDLILRLRGVASGCKDGTIEIFDKDDLIHLLTSN